MAIESATRYRFARFELQPDERRLLADGRAVPLGPRAFDLLLALVPRSGRLVTKTELLTQIWGRVVVEDNALQAHISALRKALGPEAIATVPGQGYRFTLGVEPVQRAAEAAPPRKHNLPQPVTSFIGREREIAEIRRFLATTRLLTLTGAGGCGKTRLALQVAGNVHEGFPDGVWLVELAPLGDASLLAQTVAKALAVDVQPGRDIIDAVVAWIGPQHLLLVLDNTEHLLDASARLTDGLLRRCAHLSILATSREQFGIHGEQHYRVPSLSVPSGLDSVDVLASEAARLFIDRARLQRPDFEVVTRQDAEALASICRRLDGIALAIELAAPRVRLMSLPALSQGLDDRFRVLTGGSRTALPRHRTLRSLLDWSHELLTDPEKAVLRRASVFAGGWTLEAAEHVCCGEGVAPADGLGLLTALTDKSLVVAEVRGAEARFGMLETMRHYAQEQLRFHGEQAWVHARHVQYLTDMAGGLGAEPGSAGFGHTLRRLDAERDNLRAALARCEDDPALALAGLRLAGLLDPLWNARGQWEEGVSWLTRLLAVAPAGDRGEVHARALHVLGKLEFIRGNPRAGAAPLREAIGLWRELGNRRRLLYSLGTLGGIERQRGDAVSARVLFEETLAIAREIDDPRSIATALNSFAQTAMRLGEHAVAATLMDECLPLSRAIGPLKTAEALQTVAWLRHAGGDLDAARAALAEAAQLYRDAGYLGQLVWSLTTLSVVLQDLQDIPAAKALLLEALDLAPAGSPGLLGPAWLESIASLLTGLGSAVLAVPLCGLAQRLRDETGEAGWNPQRQQRLVAAARLALQDDAAFDRAWDEGRSWSYAEAVRHACAAIQGDLPMAGAPPAAAARQGGADGA